jgi:hypothetical protein
MSETQNYADNKALKTTIIELFDAAKQKRKPHEARWEKAYRYKLSMPNKSAKKKWMTNRFIPYTKTVLDIFVPVFTLGKSVMRAEGLDNASVVVEDSFNHVYEYYQKEDNLDSKIDKAISAAAQYGTAHLYTGWKTETAANIPYSTEYIQGKIASYQARGIQIDSAEKLFDLYDGLNSQYVEHWDLYPDPMAVDPESLNFMFHLKEVTKQDMLANPAYNDEETRAKINSLKSKNKDVSNTRVQKLKMQGLSTSQATSVGNKMADSFLEELNFYGLLDINGDGMEEMCHVVLVNREEIISMKEVSCIPYDALYLDKEEGEYWGYGMVDRIADLQDDLNDIANQQGDNRKFALNAIITMTKDALKLNPAETRESAPGNILLKEKDGDISFERPPDSTAQLANLARDDIQMMQLVSGVNDVVVGGSSEATAGIASDTATGANIAREQSAKRFSTFFDNIDRFRMSVSNKQIKLLLDNYDRTKMIKALDGEKYESFDPNKIWGRFRTKLVSRGLDEKSPAQKNRDLQEMIDSLPVEILNIPTIAKMKVKNAGYDPEEILILGETAPNDRLKQLAAMQPLARQQLYEQQNFSSTQIKELEDAIALINQDGTTVQQ